MTSDFENLYALFDNIKISKNLHSMLGHAIKGIKALLNAGNVTIFVTDE